MTAETWYYEMLGILMERFNAKGNIYISNAFEVKGRGIVLGGYLRGNILPDTILINLDGSENIKTVTRGLECYQKLEYSLDAGSGFIGCGVLIPEKTADVQ